jgi:hypothetical protein
MVTAHKIYLKHSELTPSQQQFVYKFCNNATRKYIHERANNKYQYGIFVYWDVESLVEHLEKANPKRKQSLIIKDEIVGICMEAMEYRT